MVRLLFTSQPGFIGFFIKFFTWSEYSHVDLIMSDEDTVIGSTFWKGVDIDSMEDRLKRSNTYMVLMIENFPENLIEDLEVTAYSKLGTSYDWKGVLDFIFHLGLQSDKKNFCSEFISEIFIKVWKPLQMSLPRKTTPRDLSITPYGKIIQKQFKRNGKWIY